MYIYVIKSSCITRAKKVRNDQTIVVHGPERCAGKEPGHTGQIVISRASMSKSSSW